MLMLLSLLKVKQVQRVLLLGTYMEFSLLQLLILFHVQLLWNRLKL